MVPQRLSMVTFGARDLPVLRRFYLGLGWQEIAGGNDNWCAFLLGGVLFSLFPDESLRAESGAPEGRGGFTLTLNVDTKDEVDVTFAAMTDAGATAMGGPQEREWGGRSGYVADPEGNIWEIAWAPNLVVGDRGEVLSFG